MDFSIDFSTPDLAKFYKQETLKKTTDEGWFRISIKIDVIRIENGLIIHKQIEKTNGMTFMRMKRRRQKDFYS